jgi:DNA-binding NarL/FixJ family response regulator
VSTSAPETLDRSVIRVGIFDDHSLVSETLALVLNDRGFCAVGMNPSDFSDVEVFAAERDLHVVLLDLDFGELGLSLPLIPRLRERGCRVIVVTGDASRPNWGACIEAGACCVISKAVSFSELLERVILVLDDVIEIQNAERYELLEALRRHREDERRRLAPFRRLTGREQEVLRALSLGLSADDIAASKFLSIATVRTHIRSILQKLGVNSQLAAVALAQSSGWQAASE